MGGPTPTNSYAKLSYIGICFPHKNAKLQLLYHASNQPHSELIGILTMAMLFLSSHLLSNLLQKFYLPFWIMLNSAAKMLVASL